MNVSFKSDLHPYECGQNCIHCQKAVEDGHYPVLCAFCREDYEYANDFMETAFNVSPMRQLRSHGTFDVMHGGREYGPLFEGVATTEYQRDETVDGMIAYCFKLTGAHFGSPIEVLMVYPHWEPDSYDGVWYCWHALLWADDRTSFDNEYFDDAYTDPLRDELKEIAKGWG